MIDLNENTYCLGLWFLPGDRQDFLAAVLRDGTGTPFKLVYRELVEMVDGLVSALVDAGYATGQLWRRVIKGDATATFEALKGAPFVSMRERPTN